MTISRSCTGIASPKKEREQKDKIWQVLCKHYFQQFITPNDSVLDIACGQGEFIRHIECAKKTAVDLNPEVRAELPSDIRFICASADALHEIESQSVGRVFHLEFFRTPRKQRTDERRLARGAARIA